nr:immunoglobulin light chain junction region [Macaca mulatta]MOW60244.1 immunoglobulin light chain junction region [Macaca mulatta]MOW60318.1 immunoglobulin light chain junction region [Macaca mulatta]MOW60339.1 immunoglobulin light chain junction region [Macaca mulatta]MOW61577.1 immunoglobulin light chain junction region [Macaca mulatta]
DYYCQTYDSTLSARVF